MIAFPEISYRSMRVRQRNRDVFLNLWKTDALPLFLEPLIIIAITGVGFGRVISDVGDKDYLEFVGPGILAAYVMFAPSFENSWGSYVRMAVRKTFDALIVTPLHIEDVITGEILWGTTRAVLTGSVILVILAAMGFVHSPLALPILPMMVLEGFLFASLAMTYTSKAPSVGAFNYFYSLFIYPMLFFGGVFLALEDLPPALERFAWVLPLTPAVHIVRNLMDGNLVITMLWSALGLAGAAVALFYLSLVFMRQRLIQ